MRSATPGTFVSDTCPPGDLWASSRHLFLWAAITFGSRAFTSQVLSDTLPADQARPAGHDHPRHQELQKLFSDGFPVLCPLLDVLNYKPGALVEWQPRFSYVGLQVLEQYESGQEICNNYGPRDNENLMLGYGFAISSNPFDHFSVGLRVPRGSPLAQTRTWYTDKKKLEDFQCYIFNLNHPRAKSASCLEASVFSFDLLDSISVLCANDRELQAMFESKGTYISARLASKTNGNNRNLLHTITQLYRECHQRLDLLKRSDPKSNGEVARTQRQRYAQIYRESQTEILATAKLLCKAVLVRARTDNPAEVLRIVRGPSNHNPSQFEQTATSNLQELVFRHHTSLTQSHELFSFTELSQLLPVEAQEEVLDFLEPVQLSTPESQRARLAGLLAVLQRSRLPSRFEGWFARLNEWYDDSWSTLGIDGSDDDADGDRVRAMLMKVVESSQQLSLRRLAERNFLVGNVVDLDGLTWAWNVVGEESVQIPSGPVPDSGQDEDGDGEDGALLMLYIPH